MSLLKRTLLLLPLLLLTSCILDDGEISQVWLEQQLSFAEATRDNLYGRQTVSAGRIFRIERNGYFPVVYLKPVFTVVGVRQIVKKAPGELEKDGSCRLVINEELTVPMTAGLNEVIVVRTRTDSAGRAVVQEWRKYTPPENPVLPN